MYSVFIVHANEDLELARRVRNFLSRIEVRGHIQQEIARYGREPLPEEIKKAIANSNFLVALLTPHGMRSKWVNQEIGYAIGMGIPIIPIKTKEVNLKGFIENYKYLLLDLDNPDLALINLLIDIRHDLGIDEAKGRCPECWKEVIFELENQEILHKMSEEGLVYTKKCDGCGITLQMDPDTLEISKFKNKV